MVISFFYILYLSFYFLRLHEYRPETADTAILSVLLAVCLLIYVFKREKNLKTIILPFLLGYFLWALLSHASFGYLQGMIDTADALYRVIILYLISAAIFVNKDRLEFFMKFICLCALVMAVHGIDQFHGGGVGWTGVTLVQQTRIRYLGVFGDPNDLGMLFLIAIPFYFYFLSKSRFIFAKLLWLISVSILLYAIYLTNSRGTLLGLFVLLGFYGWHKYSRVVMVTCMSIVLPLAFAVTRLSTISSSESSARDRVDAWAEGFFMLRSDPLFGVGHDLFTDYHDLVAHSSYVQTFSEIGLIGYYFWLSMFAIPMYYFYKYSYKYKPVGVSNDKGISKKVLNQKMLATSILYSLLAFSACAFFISRSTQPLLFILCGMSAGLLSIIQKSAPDFEQPSFKGVFKLSIFAAIASIVIIWLSIKIFW